MVTEEEIKQCKHDYYAEWRSKNKDKIKEYNKKYWKKYYYNRKRKKLLKEVIIMNKETNYISTENTIVTIDCPQCAEGIPHLIGYNQYFDEDNELCLHLIFGCEAGHYFEKYIARDEDGVLVLAEEDNMENNI